MERLEKLFIISNHIEGRLGKEAKGRYSCDPFKQEVTLNNIEDFNKICQLDGKRELESEKYIEYVLDLPTNNGENYQYKIQLGYELKEEFIRKYGENYTTIIYKYNWKSSKVSKKILRLSELIKN